ncbi:hypothetical protein SAMN04488030_0366 [Aliiroseovarius halocynthiae]|nr:hypothetical protein SAMN04488030_0366 [Aliiroseovarius halocynthiae]
MCRRSLGGLSECCAHLTTLEPTKTDGDLSCLGCNHERWLEQRNTATNPSQMKCGAQGWFLQQSRHFSIKTLRVDIHGHAHIPFDLELRQPAF